MADLPDPLQGTTAAGRLVSRADGRRMTQSGNDVPRLVSEWAAGDESALARLIDLVYEDLRQIAHRHLRRERSDHTLNTTALVHEAYLELAERTGPEWQGRARFFALVSRVMRHVLVDYARSRGAAKRGGGRVRVPLREDSAAVDGGLVDLLAMDEALEALAQKDERLARVVECRFFGGLSDAEIANALGVSERTVGRDWQRARAWLFRMLSAEAREAE